MKKILTSIFVICAFALAFGSGRERSGEKVIRLSASEWDVVKQRVDTNGYCRITGQHAVIVITNGCSNIDYMPPIWSLDDDLERNGPDLKYKSSHEKVLPYPGQTLM